MTDRKTKKVSLKDIARQAGVSTSLTSFALNGKGKEHRISEETVRHIIQIAKDLNYKPNIAAKNLRSGKSGVIGVVIPDISNIFFAQIVRSMEDVAARLGYTVFFGSSDEYVQKLQDLVESLINRGVDGFIIAPCEHSEKFIHQLVDSNIPIVQFDRPYKNIESSYVTLNNHKAAYLATSHLIEAGFRRIGMIAYDISLSHMQERIEGYKAAMEDHGLKSEICIGFAKSDNLRKSTAKVIAKMKEKGIDALFFATNTISVAGLYAISEQKIAIPSELGLVGFDGSDAFELCSTPLSYIKQPVEKLSKKAVEILVNMLKEENRAIQCVQIDGELIVNASSSC